MSFFDLLQTWILYALAAFFFLGYKESWMRAIIWLAFWIPGSPVRPPLEDLPWMLACHAASEFVYRQSLKVVFAPAAKR